MEDHSIVFWYPNLEKHLCGYCKNETGNISHGMWAQRLTVDDYQKLIDRGWRRSGKYCYKPIMDQVCCPMYTIKCDAVNFKVSKSQKKVVKKFNKFLQDGVLNKTIDCSGHSDSVSEFVYREAPKQVLEEQDFVLEKKKTVEDVVDKEAQTIQETPDQSTSAEPPCDKSNEPKTGSGADPTKPPCKKAKFIRMERKKEKLLKRGMSLEKIVVKNEQKCLEDFFNEAPQDGKHKLKLQLISADTESKDWKKVKENEFELYKKYQIIVHNDPPEKCQIGRFINFLVDSPLEITLEQIHEQHKYFKLTADLFAKYQISVHNDTPSECDSDQFTSFLLDSPLQPVRFNKNSDLGFGSFHQLYWLDDKLIAVGVIDILPKCVSAVYFFYDPDYRDLTLGTYGALREVEFARKLHEKLPSISNYYMGFYIHSCPKMRYKGNLTPSYLLCPESYAWIPIEKCIPKLEKSKYSRLNEDETAVDQNDCTESDIDEMKILVNRRLILFRHYRRQLDLYFSIGKLIGKDCLQSIIFVGKD